MKPQDFARRAVGLPWVKWRSDWAAMDCFGLVVLWFREVLGIELGDVPHTDIAAGLAAAPEWVETDSPEGAVMWMAWVNGVPVHCGVFLDQTYALHADGSEERPGTVRLTRRAALHRTYGLIKLYRYQQC